MSRESAENYLKSVEIFQLGNFRFDAKRLQLQGVDGDRIALRSQNAKVLAELLGQSAQVISKDDLMPAVWTDTFATDDSLKEICKSSDT